MTQPNQKPDNPACFHPVDLLAVNNTPGDSITPLSGDRNPPFCSLARRPVGTWLSPARLLVPQNQPVLGEKAHLRGEVLSKAQGPAGPGLDGDFQQRVRMLQEPAWLAASKVRMRRLAEIPLPCAHPSVMQVAPPKERANPRVGTLTQ